MKGINYEELYQVRVHYTGVNYADVCVRWGLYSSAKQFVGWPITPGFEFCGVVTKVGRHRQERDHDHDIDQGDDNRGEESSATSLSVGSSVIGVTMFGGYSTHVLVPRSQLLPLPSGIPPSVAAGLPCAVLTAWYALHILATPGRSPGGSEGVHVQRSCLVHSAAGGVGSMICRLAKASGRWSPIVGVVGSPHKVPVLESMGCCDVVVCKKAMDDDDDDNDEKTNASSSYLLSYLTSLASFFPTFLSPSWWTRVERACPGGFDAVFDANGKATFRQSYNHLKPEGRLVVYGFHTMLPKEGGRLTPYQWLHMAWDWLLSPTFDPLEMVPSNRSVLAFNLSFLFHRADLFREVMGRVLDMIAAGELGEMQEPRLFKLEDVGKAHKAIESGMTTGKLVLDAR